MKGGFREIRVVGDTGLPDDVALMVNDTDEPTSCVMWATRALTLEEFTQVLAVLIRLGCSRSTKIDFVRQKRA